MREAASKNNEDWVSSSKGSIFIHHSLYTKYIEAADIGCLPFAKKKCKVYNAQVRKHLGNLNFRQWIFRCKMTVGPLTNRPFLPKISSPIRSTKLQGEFPSTPY